MAPVWRWHEQVRTGPSAALDWGFTSAEGGVSTGSFSGLNLGGHVGDDPADVETNRGRVAEAVGLPRERLLFMNQCHGADVHVVDGPWSGPVASGVFFGALAEGVADGSDEDAEVPSLSLRLSAAYFRHRAM